MEKRIPKIGELFHHGKLSSYQPVYIRLDKYYYGRSYFKSLQLIGYQLDPKNHEWETKYTVDDVTSFSCKLVSILYGVEYE